MTLNRVKRGRAVTVMKYLDSVAIWNKTTFHLSNLPNLAELVVNNFTKSISKKI